MIPWDEKFENLAAKVLFNQNMLCLEWQPGNQHPPHSHALLTPTPTPGAPIPEGIVESIIKGIGIDDSQPQAGTTPEADVTRI